METFRRRLPHHYPQDAWLFLTWHLHGSLPQGLYPPPSHAKGGRAFVWIDRYLDTVRTGPNYLAQEQIARVAVSSLKRGEELGHYRLRAWAIMPNHVHVLLLPAVSPSKLLRAIKGVTAREANLILGRTGEVCWQAESYDHWVRNAMGLKRIVRYIEENPVKAGLAARVEEYRWSSAFVGPPSAVESAGPTHS